MEGSQDQRWSEWWWWEVMDRRALPHRRGPELSTTSVGSLRDYLVAKSLRAVAPGSSKAGAWSTAGNTCIAHPLLDHGSSSWEQALHTITQTVKASGRSMGRWRCMGKAGGGGGGEV